MVLTELIRLMWAEEEHGSTAWAQSTTPAQSIRMLCHEETFLSLVVPSEITHESEPGGSPILTGA